MKKGKIIYLTLLLFALVLCLVGCNNGDDKEDNNAVKETVGLAYVRSADGNGYLVSGIGTANTNHIIIPSVYEGKPVVGIKENSFKENTYLSSITIPDTVTIIGSYAFFRCDRLASVNFGKNSQLESIGSAAFYNCDNLRSFNFPNTLKNIGEEAFYECSTLTNITLPDSLISIGRVAFAYTPDFIKMDNEGSVYFGKHLLRAETSLSFDIKEGTLCIADEAFMCEPLTSIIIPASVKSIGKKAFDSCEDLNSVTFSEGSQIQSISSSAFDYCKKLKTVTFGDYCQFKTIDTLFNGNETIETVVFGKNSQMTSISKYAFYDCFYLKSVSIPKSVTEIGQCAFYECYKLEHIYYEGTMAEWNAIRKGIQWDLFSGDYTVYCSDGNLTK